MDLNPWDRMGDGMGGAPDYRKPDLSTPEGVVQRQLQLLERSRRFNEQHEAVRAVILKQQLDAIDSIRHGIGRPPCTAAAPVAEPASWRPRWWRLLFR